MLKLKWHQLRQTEYRRENASPSLTIVRCAHGGKCEREQSTIKKVQNEKCFIYISTRVRYDLLCCSALLLYRTSRVCCWIMAEWQTADPINFSFFHAPPSTSHLIFVCFFSHFFYWPIFARQTKAIPAVMTSLCK